MDDDGYKALEAANIALQREIIRERILRLRAELGACQSTIMAAQLKAQFITMELESLSSKDHEHGPTNN